MDRLSAAQLAQIRAAFQDVADTFHKSIIDYKRYIGSVDSFNEDNLDAEYQHYEIPCLVEFVKFDRDKVKQYSEGKLSNAELMIQILYDNLEDLGLTTVDNFVIMDQTKDKLIHKGVAYEVIYVGLEGPMEDKNVLVTLFADPEVREAV